MKRSVLLLGSYGRGNIGDDAFLLAATRLLKDYDITINAAADLPSDLRDKVRVLSTEGMGDWRLKLRALAEAKAVIYGGGDLWVDLVGAKRPRASLWKMVAVNLVSRGLGKKVIYIGCGAGQLRGLSLALARISAALANLVLVRDEETKKTLGIKRAQVLPDLTITLFPEPPEPSAFRPGKKMKILISVLYYIPAPHKNFAPYIKSIADFVNGLDKNIYQITLLSMLSAPTTEKNDSWACEQLLKLLSGPNVAVAKPKRVEDCLSEIEGADLVIGSRLHANVLAAWLGRPSIGIAYRPKVRRFFVENQLTDRCLNLKQLDALPLVAASIASAYPDTTEQLRRVWQTNMEKGRTYARLIQEQI